MSVSLIARRLALLLPALLLPVFTASAKPVELPAAQPGDVPGKIEVLEFFSYTCNHCAALEPFFSAWMANQGEAVAVRHVPVAFNAGMRPTQQLYYALEALGRLDLHPKVFRAIHQERQRIFTKSAIVNWAKAQGLDEKRFTDTFDSFGVAVKVGRADTLTQTYALEGTPTVVVGGRYITSPSHAGGYRETVLEVDQLVQQLLAQLGADSTVDAGAQSASSD